MPRLWECRERVRFGLGIIGLLMLTQQCVAPIPPQVAYFNGLRERCEDVDCTRRVGLCQSDQLRQTYDSEYLALKNDCLKDQPDLDPDLCAHLQLGDYNIDGTMRPDILKEHFEESFKDDPELLGDLLSRVGVCDRNIPAQDYLECVLESCVSSDMEEGEEEEEED